METTPCALRRTAVSPRLRLLAVAALALACDAPGLQDGGRSDLLAALHRATFSDNLAAALARSHATPTNVAVVGRWNAEGGELRNEELILDGVSPPRVVRLDPAVADGELGAEVRLVQGSRGVSSGGLLLRSRGADDGVGTLVQEGVGVTLFRLRDGGMQAIAHRPMPIVDGRWYRVALRARGSRFHVAVDGTEVLAANVPDATAAGGIGVLRGGGEGVAIRALALARGGAPVPVHLAVSAPDPLLAPLLDRARGAPGNDPRPSVLRGIVEIGGDHRDCLLVPPGTEVRLPVTVRAGARLRYDVAVAADAATDRAATSRLEIAEDGGAALGTHYLALPQPGWRSVEVALSRSGRSALRLRNHRIGSVPGLVAAVCNPSIEPARPERRRPNLLLLTIDTLRADRLGTYRHARATSPFLDALAAEGVVFETVVAQSSWTKASMASLLSSTYPERNGVRGTGQRLPPDLDTLAAALGRAGYFTMGVQSNPWVHPRFGLARGFAEYRLLGGTPRAGAVHEAALEMLSRRGSSPFFLYLHYMDVHHPYDPPPAYRTFGERPGDLYDGAIRHLDDQLADFHRTLERLGLLDDTLVVVTSDHGEEFGEHGGSFHGTTLHREQIEVPWIVSWRGRLAPGRQVGVVRNLDVAPTLLDLLSVAAPRTFEGASLKERLLRGAAADAPPREWFAQVGLNDAAPDRDLVAMGTDGWRYMVDRLRGTRLLFEASTDPGERHDRTADRPDVAARLQERVDAFLARYASRPKTEDVGLDPDLTGRLRALGYLDGGHGAR